MAQYQAYQGGITYDYTEQVSNGNYPTPDEVRANIQIIKSGGTVPGFIALTADTTPIKESLSTSSPSSGFVTIGLLGLLLFILFKKPF
jgi:hypothetical protein